MQGARTCWAGGLVVVVIQVVAFLAVNEFLASLLDGLALLSLAVPSIFFICGREAREKKNQTSKERVV
jgi:hypothetical protein